VQGGIDEARQRAGLPSAPGTPPATAAAPAGNGRPASTDAVRVAGTVTLSPALAAQAAPDDTVFVFARAAQGPRMPLAVLRRQVRDLPLKFTLDDSLAMSPAARLSMAPQVVVGARISKSGQALPQPGDLLGESAAVALGRSDLKIEIAQVVPR
jgi:cytochrome c-type biogenesis protein CcmH